MKDATFDGLPEAPWRYEAPYPGPLGEQHVEVVQDTSGLSIKHVSLLASGGLAWSGWHKDSTGEKELSTSWIRESSCGSSPLAHAR